MCVYTVHTVYTSTYIYTYNICVGTQWTTWEFPPAREPALLLESALLRKWHFSP